MTNSVDKFKKAFPEHADLSNEEAIAFISSFKSNKRKADKWIEKRVKSYEKNYR
jgi:hypothetical protein